SWAIPSAGPRPHIADHVEEPIAVRLEAADRRGPGVAVLVRVVDGKDALPGIGHRLALGIEGARPVVLAVATAARGEFPLRLGRELTPAPARVGQRILVGDMHGRMIVLACNRRAGPGGRAQMRARHVLPPLRDPAAAADIGGRDEHHGAGSEQLPGHAGMRCGVEPALGQRHVSRRRHELPELRVGHLVAIDPKAVDTHHVGEALLRPLAIGAHNERAAADENHAGGIGVVRWQAGIAGGASEIASSHVLLRDGCGERADHQTCGTDANGADQQAAQYHGTFSAMVRRPRSIADVPISSGTPWAFRRSRCVSLFVAGARGVRHVYLGGEYGSGVPILIGGYFFTLSKNSVTIFVTGTTTHELVQGVPSRSSLRSVRRLMTFGSGRVNGGSYMFCCQIKWTFQFRHLTADNRSAT